MSGIAGIVRWDAAPIADETVRALTASIAHRGLDGVRLFRRDGIAMVFAKTITTPEGAFDDQPIVDAASGVHAVFDGRLDNREELARALRLDAPLATLTDAALAAMAYGQWGRECAVHLLGDFSFVVWDARERRVFAARDIMGVRPLYYRADRDAFAWASDFSALATGEVNTGYVAEVLAHQVTSCDETIHRGVLRLPMAHALTAHERSGMRTWRYWRPSPDAEIRYRDVRDYEAHFRDVFREAVRARLRLAGGAALLLSGGIDSSSIAAEVHAQERDGLLRPGTVEAFSTVVPGHDADEGPAIRAVAERTGIRSHCFPLEQVRDCDFTADAVASLDLPAAPDSLQQAAAEQGLRVVLSGSGGDEWFFGTTGDLADLIRGGRPLRAAAWLRDARRVPNAPPSSARARMALWMAAPERTKPIVRRLLRRRAVPPWIDPRFAEIVGLEDRLRARPDRVEFASIGNEYAFWAATRGNAAFHNEQGERAAARDGLEERHPFYDRRLIELALAMPAAVRCADGIPKGLVRRAMAADLPPIVTGMPPEADFGFLTTTWLDSLGGGGRVTASRPCGRGWVRRDRIGAMYGEMMRGRTRYLWPIWAVFAVDVWLDAIERLAGAEEGRWHGNARRTSEQSGSIHGRPGSPGARHGSPSTALSPS